MAVTNINNNSAAQLQLYAQQKRTTASDSAQQPGVTADPAPPASGSNADSVQISAQAKNLLALETKGNGGGIIPPGTAPETGSSGQVSTQGNGGGIIPPGTVEVGSSAPGITTLGNGGGIIPPGN